MKKIILLSALLTFVISLPVSADIVVVVHPSNPNNALDSVQIRKIFLGKSRAFPNGLEVNPFEQESGNESRDVFIKKVLRKNEGNLNSYWARMIFSNKAMPPISMTNAQEMKNMIAKNANAIGYIDSADIDNSVKIVFTIKQ